jgi:hypothetical protein
MDYLGPTLIVFAVLIAVTVAVVVFEPASPFARWIKLAERYATDERPSQIQFSNELIEFGGTRGALKPLAEGLRFDITLDDFGLWLICRGETPEDFATRLKIPGTHVRFIEQRGDAYLFDLFAEPPVRIALQGPAGREVFERKTAGASGE